MKHVIEADQRGLKFRNGKFLAVLHPGRYSAFLGSRIENYAVSEEFEPARDLRTLLEYPKLKEELEIFEVADQEIGLLYEDKNFKKCLGPGLHAFWKSNSDYTFFTYDLREAFVPEDISVSVLDLPAMQDKVQILDVASFECALLMLDGQYQKTLKPGKYRFWQGPVKVSAQHFDLRSLKLDVLGQEIMTKDKVTLRLNFVCRYRIADPLKLHTSIQKYTEQLYTILQLILREYVGNLKLDELLEQKEQIAQFALKSLRERVPDWGLEFLSAGVKDIILPGEIKTILQQVIEAEKKALANTITRREETASTRSLLNTARLMQENPTLMKLKEMEHIQLISQNISQMNLTSGDSVAVQLARLLGAATDSDSFGTQRTPPS